MTLSVFFYCNKESDTVVLEESPKAELRGVINRGINELKRKRGNVLGEDDIETRPEKIRVSGLYPAMQLHAPIGELIHDPDDHIVIHVPSRNVQASPLETSLRAFEELKKRIDDGFKRLEEQTNELKAQTDELKEQTNELTARTERLEEQTNDLKEQTDELKARTKKLEEYFEDSKIF